MKRLTTNKDVQEMGMVELAHNSCYVKDGAAWYRDFSSDMDARGLARKLLKDFAEGDDSFTCDEDFDECIAACLEDGMDSVEGLIALFYRNLWAMADLHTRLKRYEDLQEQGRLLELPCDIGQRVYEIYQFMGEGAWEIDEHKIRLEDLENIGKTVFLTKEAAEAALKEIKSGLTTWAEDEAYKLGIEKAIDIVKAGGVNEN